MTRAVRTLGAQAAVAGLLALETWREAARQRVFPAFLGIALILVVSVLALRTFNFGDSETRFVVDFGFGVLGIMGALLAIVATTVLFFAEIEHRVIQTVLARPVTRGAYLAGKWSGLSVLLGVFGLLVLALLAGLLVGHGLTDLAWTTFVIAGALQLVKLAVLVAITLLLAVTARTHLLAGMLALMVWLCGQAHPVLVEVARDGSTVWLRSLARVGGWLVPDFAAYDFTRHIATTAPVAWPQVAGVALEGLATVMVALVLATWALQRREL